ncbi:hypothetical protein V2J09_022319 [Rumex salicifolius]
MELITGQPPLMKYTSKSDECIHIVDWVKLAADRGDILKIVDERLKGAFNANSAWRLLEIGVECVKPRGDERPRMGEVVAELKLCYASEQIDLADDDDDGGGDDYRRKIIVAGKQRMCLNNCRIVHQFWFGKEARVDFGGAGEFYERSAFF